MLEKLSAAGLVALIVTVFALPGCLALAGDAPTYCSIDDDCLDGRLCTLAKCSDAPSCTTDTDCDSVTDLPRVGYCASGKCARKPDCQGYENDCLPYRCVGHRCATSCVDDAACANGRSCSSGKCSP